MVDKRQQIIKDRLRMFAMDLWNITDLSQIDPVIDLILDVIAYNSSRLHQSIVDFGSFDGTFEMVAPFSFSCLDEC